jgi:hypothetical protein
MAEDEAKVVPYDNSGNQDLDKDPKWKAKTHVFHKGVLFEPGDLLPAEVIAHKKDFPRLKALGVITTDAVMSPYADNTKKAAKKVDEDEDKEDGGLVGGAETKSFTKGLKKE